LHFFIFKFEF
jgi:hypothetical protein